MINRTVLTLYLLVLVTFLGGCAAQSADPQPANPDGGGLELSADPYIISEDKNTPFIVLFHQAGWSRGEYLETAPRLNELGFNVLAVDQRAGGEVNGVENETAAAAKEAGLDTDFVAAYEDVVDAVDYARTIYADGTLLALGSSYSASLVLKLAGDTPDALDGVLAFSPGEYFASLGESDTWITESAVNISVPAFVTSAKNETDIWQTIFEAIPTETKVGFVPEGAGRHGSSALWESDGSAEYWIAVEGFLAQFQ